MMNFYPPAIPNARCPPTYGFRVLDGSQVCLKFVGLVNGVPNCSSQCASEVPGTEFYSAETAQEFDDLRAILQFSGKTTIEKVNVCL